MNQTTNALLEKQDELTRANRELESFVSTVSHDLRNPLTVIIGFSEHLRQHRGNDLDKQALACLEEIEIQGMRMAALLEDLLALAKVGHTKSPVQSIDVDKTLADVLSELDHLLAYKKVTVNVGELPKLHVPETLLAGVFKNLIENALCHACKGGDTIDVWGEREQSFVRFNV